MTASDLLTMMTVFDNELQIGSGASDETRALSALDMAQDYYETVAATYPRIKGAATALSITANESDAWPTNLLRLDSLWMIDTTVTPNRPLYEIMPIGRSGGHASVYTDWPSVLLTLPAYTNGRPTRFWTDRANLYWFPFPDTTYTARIYGFSHQTNLTTRSITFGHPDVVAAPTAAFAVRLLEMGIDDPSEELAALAKDWYAPALKLLSSGFTRIAPRSRRYSRVHDT